MSQRAPMPESIIMVKTRPMIRLARILRPGRVTLQRCNDGPWSEMADAEPCQDVNRYAATLTRVGFVEARGAKAVHYLTAARGEGFDV